MCIVIPTTRTLQQVHRCSFAKFWLHHHEDVYLIPQKPLSPKYWVAHHWYVPAISKPDFSAHCLIWIPHSPHTACPVLYMHANTNSKRMATSFGFFQICVFRSSTIALTVQDAASRHARKLLRKYNRPRYIHIQRYHTGIGQHVKRVYVQMYYTYRSAGSLDRFNLS